VTRSRCCCRCRRAQAARGRKRAPAAVNYFAHMLAHVRRAERRHRPTEVAVCALSTLSEDDNLEYYKLVQVNAHSVAGAAMVRRKRCPDANGIRCEHRVANSGGRLGR
jgi:hypothetical protein